MTGIGEIWDAYVRRAKAKLEGKPMPGSLEEQIGKLQIRKLEADTKPQEAKPFNFGEELNRGNQIADAALEQRKKQELLRLQTLGAPSELDARGKMLSQEDASAIGRMQARAGLIGDIQGDIQAQELAMAGGSDFDKLKYITKYAKEQNAQNLEMQKKAATMNMIGRGLAGAAALASLFA